MRGFSLLEVLVSATLLLVLSVVFVSAIVDSETGTQIGGQRVRATFLANEGLEAARNIRDKNFTLLINGSFGVATTGNAWVLSGSSDTQDIFTRTVAVASVDIATQQITSTVTWPESPVRTGSVSVVTYLGNTQLLATQANSFIDNTASAAAGGSGNTDVLNMTWQNIGSSTIIVTNIETSWTTSGTLTQVVVNGGTVWTGNQINGGDELLTGATVPGGTTLPVTRYRFSGSMNGSKVTTIFTFSDGSTKTFTTGTL